MKNLTGLLAPIADALQIVLHYMGRSGNVKGHRQIHVELANGVALPVGVEVEASYLYPFKEQAGILCKMGGSLHLLMCYAGRHDTVSAYLLDARKFKGGQNTLRRLVVNAGDLRSMHHDLTLGIAASYIKKPFKQWKSFEVAKE